MEKNCKARYFLLITLFAFLMNAIVPFFATYTIPTNFEEEKFSVFGSKLLICTSEGFKWINIEDLKTGKEKPQPHQSFKCPVCYVADRGLKATSSTHFAGLDYHPVIQLFQFQANFQESSSGRLFLGSNPVRAPPISVIVFLI